MQKVGRWALTLDYRRPVRKLTSLNDQKSTPAPKFLGTAEAYFVCHIAQIFRFLWNGCWYYSPWLEGFLERSFKDKLWGKDKNDIQKQPQISLAFLKEYTAQWEPKGIRKRLLLLNQFQPIIQLLAYKNTKTDMVVVGNKVSSVCKRKFFNNKMKTFIFRIWKISFN